MDLAFQPINLELHSSLCIIFRADSFIESFGTDYPFFDEDNLGTFRYIDWLKSRDPNRHGSFHIWLNGKIIGQLELGESKGSSEAGYVFLYYLVPEWRGKGLSQDLDKYAMDFLKTLGFNKVRLSVSPTNLRAVKFYKKNGWIDLGMRDEPELRKTLKFPLHYMEKKI